MADVKQLHVLAKELASLIGEIDKNEGTALKGENEAVYISSKQSHKYQEKSKADSSG